MIFQTAQRAILRSSMSEVAEVNGKLVRCVFFAEYLAVDPSTNNHISLNEPKIGVCLDDLDERDIDAFNVVKFRNATYYISDVQKDGEGMAELMLKSKL